MTPPPTSLFQPFLLPAERVLWTGKPKRGIALRPMDAFLIPFSLIWAAFAIFWNIGVWILPADGEEPELFFRLFGLPFLVIGIYVVAGRFMHDARIRKNIAYAVTDQRILVLSGSRSSKFSSMDLRRLPRLDLTEHRDNTGTIAFGDGPSLFNYGRYGGFDWWVPSLGASSQFFRIDDPRHVYQLIRDHSRRA